MNNKHIGLTQTVNMANMSMMMRGMMMRSASCLLAVEMF